VEGGDLSKIYDWNLASDAFSNRVVSLTNATLDFLDGEPRRLFRLQLIFIVSEIGAWAHVDVERTCPIEEMQVLSRPAPIMSYCSQCIRSGMASLMHE
jgi:ubiquinone biosynthesis monooxygenase Coq6